MAKEKERLDVLLVNRGLAVSREKAKTLIMAGDVFVNGQREDKPGTTFEESKIKTLEVKGDTLPYVSRGGLKLEKAVNNFGFSLEKKICMDIGASTGGFTDCMLQNGASKVYSVDVGHGQLAPSLKADERVTDLEGTDIRDITAEDIGGEADFICADVSFISLTKILPKIYELLKEGACASVLIKPQFEAGKKDIGKKGIVKDRKVHIRVLTETDAFASSLGFICEKYTYSPIKGGSGNIEYLVKLCKRSGTPVVHDFRALTERAFTEL